MYLSKPILSPGRFSAAAADKVRLLEELELAQKRESHQLQDELRQRSGDAEARRGRAASDLEVAVEKIRILEAEVRGLVGNVNFAPFTDVNYAETRKCI